MYREWSTVWQGQPIAVKVWYHQNDFFLRVKEELWIGDLLVDRNKIRCLAGSSLCIRERLAAPISIDDCVHHLEVSIFTIDKTYCNISIDGELIGGDIDFKIPPTDLDTWPDTHRRGVFNFLFEHVYSNMLRMIFLIVGFIVLFLFMAISVDFVSATPIAWRLTQSRLWETGICIALFWLFVELANGHSIWRAWEKLYAQTLAHQRKLDFPPVRLEMDKHEVC